MLSQLHRGLRQAAKHAVVYMVYDPYGFYIGLEYFCWLIIIVWCPRCGFQPVLNLLVRVFFKLAHYTTDADWSCRNDRN